MGGGHDLERLNVEQPIFRNFANIKIIEVDFFITEFVFYFYVRSNYLNTQNTYMIIYHQIRKFWNLDSFIHGKILKINMLIFKIKQFQEFDYLMSLSIMGI